MPPSTPLSASSGLVWPGGYGAQSLSTAAIKVPQLGSYNSGSDSSQMADTSFVTPLSSKYYPPQPPQTPPPPRPLHPSYNLVRASSESLLQVTVERVKNVTCSLHHCCAAGLSVARVYCHGRCRVHWLHLRR